MKKHYAINAHLSLEYNYVELATVSPKWLSYGSAVSRGRVFIDKAGKIKIR